MIDDWFVFVGGFDLMCVCWDMFVYVVDDLCCCDEYGMLYGLFYDVYVMFDGDVVVVIGE